MIITVNDYRRLMRLVELASLKTRMPELTDRMFERLAASKRLPQDTIQPDIVTMNSRVRLRNLASSKEVEITLTYPPDADARQCRISVFSEIGLALLGRKENDIVSWQVPKGKGEFLVEKVVYQPEAAGDYFL